MYKISLILLFCGFSIGILALEPYKNPNLSPDDRSRDIVSRLTIEEKVSQMMNNSPGIPRLGIPPIEWWNEALHGVARAGKATVFPQTIGLAASFDKDAVKQTFSIISDEARAKHHDFKNKNQYRRYQGLTFWTPNINIFRDPRWGRGMETYGEDPFLTTQMGVAVVNGLQGEGDSKYDKTHACAKHYAVHSGPEWNRHSYDAKNISQRDLWETYLPAFESLVKDAGVKEVMCAYNRFEGEPCCSNKELLIRILRDKWGFNDIIVSDCGAISDFVGAQRHNTHPSLVEASADAVLSGTDICCGGEYSALNESVKKGLIKESELDISLHRIFKARFELGMLDPDSLVEWSKIPYSVVESKKHVDKALEMARKSMVLLKNNGVLPLKKSAKIALLGPNAHDSVMQWANYNGIPTQTVTILEAFQKILPQSSLYYDKACDIVDDKVYKSVSQYCNYNGQTGFNAKYWNNSNMEGAPVNELLVMSPIHLDNGGNTVFAQGVELQNFSARYQSQFTSPVDGEILIRSSADDGYRVIVDGKTLIDKWNSGGSQKSEYVLYTERNRKYDIVIEYYQTDRRANMHFEMDIVQFVDYTAIAEKVKDYDVIVFAGGITPRVEGEQMRVELPGFKGGDRTTIELPEVQSKMLKALKATGKPVVFVLCSGSSMALPWESKNLDAIMAAWYPGQEGGTAIADVLFGDYNPAGRLPLTFYSSTNELPDFEDYNMQGRTYRYYKGKPIYPFGHGLSYSSFKYSNAKTDKKELAKGEKLNLSVEVTNTGKLNGDEVVQVYIRNKKDKNGPIKSLKQFSREHIKSGESKIVNLELNYDSFNSFDEALSEMRVKPGEYEILYGGSSDDKKLKKLKFRIR